MRIVYMGTPDIAVPTLRYLAESKHQVVGVLTQPDRPKGRGHHTIPTAVKAAALEYDIPVYQPLSLRKGEDAAAALETLRQLNPDLIVVLAYGQILPKEVLELPKYGCINLHASLLPAYRGAAPIQWVILNGETKTGVTAQQMGEGLDTGDMLVKKETAIGPEETAEELYSRLSELCVETLEETLAQLEAGTLHGTPQDDAQSSYASRITKEMSALDFTRPAAELHNLIRGITGFTQLEGKRLKVYGSRVVEGVSGDAGTIADPAAFVVACGDGNGLRFTEIEPEGKRRMQTADFLRGKKLEKGEKLG
ncbi:methionyl-tRNA formyltransferase [Ruminococcus sp.]|uniref:methionyl-tRNA formyltransferase n=1 Tax=Ruminococcus sp. TaxID=41978 RepID=UPI003FD8F26F